MYEIQVFFKPKSLCSGKFYVNDTALTTDADIVVNIAMLSTNPQSCDTIGVQPKNLCFWYILSARLKSNSRVHCIY